MATIKPDNSDCTNSSYTYINYLFISETHSIPTSVSREFGKQPETTTMAGQKLSPTAPGTGFERTQPSIANSTDAAVVSQKRTPNSRRQNSLKKQSSIEVIFA